jgi:hypothetical protein
MTQLKKRVVLSVTLVLFGAILTVPAAAQTTASVDALATVTGGVAALTATGQQDLDFGTVTAGAGPVTPGESSWGRFYITGEPSANILVEYTTLPTTLDDGFGNTIDITFATDDGIFWGDAYAPGTFTTFNPTVSQTLALGAGSPGEMYVGIRGTVDPPATAVNGDYSGVIVLTVAYP